MTQHLLQGNIVDKSTVEKEMSQSWTSRNDTSIQALPVEIMPAVERMLLVFLFLFHKPFRNRRALHWLTSVFPYISFLDEVFLLFLLSVCLPACLPIRLPHGEFQLSICLCVCPIDPSVYVYLAVCQLVFCVPIQDAENNWQFDIFAFADATPGSTLSVLTFHLLKDTGLIDDFNMDQTKWWNFLQKVEGGYQAENPYHNRSDFAVINVPSRC